MPSCAPVDLSLKRGKSGRLAIAAAGGHGVECVGKGKDARSQRDLFPAQPVRVSGAVETFMVVADDDRGGLQDRVLLEMRTVLPRQEPALRRALQGLS